jgi:hypothetical protein
MKEIKCSLTIIEAILKKGIILNIKTEIRIKNLFLPPNNTGIEST